MNLLQSHFRRKVSGSPRMRCSTA